jgi:UDP:flavonoid glycosyltransferase YjiC (YdhE family)
MQLYGGAGTTAAGLRAGKPTIIDALICFLYD